MVDYFPMSRYCIIFSLVFIIFALNLCARRVFETMIFQVHFVAVPIKHRLGLGHGEEQDFYFLW